jgi:hypothetical protein
VRFLSSRQPKRHAYYFVIPAKAGIQAAPKSAVSNVVRKLLSCPRVANIAARDGLWGRLGPRLRGDDEVIGLSPLLRPADKPRRLRTALHLHRDDKAERLLPVLRPAHE